MRRIYVLLLFILLLLCCGCGNENIIRIGISEPTSGKLALYGNRELLGAEYANSLINTVEISGEEYQIELIRAVNDSTTTSAGVNINGLIDSKTDIIIGCFDSNLYYRNISSLITADTLMINTSGTTALLKDNDIVFNLGLSDSIQSNVLYNSIIAIEGERPITAITDNVITHKNIYNSFVNEINSYDKNTVDGIIYKEINNEFINAFDTALVKEPSAVFTFLYANDCVEIINILAKRSSAVTVIGPDCLDTPEIASVANGANAVYITSLYDESIRENFAKNFRKWLSEDKERFERNGNTYAIAEATVLAYDAYMTAVEAIRSAGSTDTNKIREILRTVTFKGVTGHFGFDEDGASKRDGLYIKTAPTGRWETVEYIELGE